MILTRLYLQGRRIRGWRMWQGVAPALPISFTAILALGAIYAYFGLPRLGFDQNLPGLTATIALLAFAYMMQNALANIMNGWLDARRCGTCP